MTEFSYFQNTILLASLHWIKFIVEVRVFYFSTKTYRWRKLRLLQKAIFHSLHQSTIHSRKYSWFHLLPPQGFRPEGEIPRSMTRHRGQKYLCEFIHNLSLSKITSYNTFTTLLLGLRLSASFTCLLTKYVQLVCQTNHLSIYSHNF